jgi:type I restriction enzyme R subunit
MLLEAVVGSERPSDELLLKIRDLTAELVDMIADELTDTFWEPHKLPAQDALGARIFRALRTSRLMAPGDVSALKDRLLELARANHERLSRS